MLFQYKVKYYDEINSKEQEARGIVYGKDFVKAVTEIQQYYGEDTLCEIYSLAPIGEDKIIEIEQSYYENLKNNIINFQQL